jgi:ubiquitin-conjugating enzyme E2 W
MCERERKQNIMTTTRVVVISVVLLLGVQESSSSPSSHSCCHRLDPRHPFLLRQQERRRWIPTATTNSLLLKLQPPSTVSSFHVDWKEIRGGAQTTTEIEKPNTKKQKKKKKKKKKSTTQTTAAASATSTKQASVATTVQLRHSISEPTKTTDNSDVDGASVRQFLSNLLQWIQPHSTLLYNLLTFVITVLESMLGIRFLVSSSVPNDDDNNNEKKRVDRKPFTQRKPTTKKNKPSTQKAPPQNSSSSATTSTLTTKTIKNLHSSSPNYRIQRELQKFVQDPPDHLQVKVGKNIRIWRVEMQGVGIYQGETFVLRIQFPNNYPMRPPSVYFVPPHIPIHEHVYTNGDICLSLLGKDWRPTMTAESIAISILSILASATSKTLPMDNARHAGNKPGEYQENWVYHDDSC